LYLFDQQNDPSALIVKCNSYKEFSELLQLALLVSAPFNFQKKRGFHPLPGLPHCFCDDELKLNDLVAARALRSAPAPGPVLSIVVAQSRFMVQFTP
jgi:hypothetical protein